MQPLERSHHHEYRTIANATEYRNLPLALLTESNTNPRRIFEEEALKELAESIRTQGVLSPLLVRPFERAAASRSSSERGVTAPRRWPRPKPSPSASSNITDAEVLEAQLIENLQRRDVHPMEEAQGFSALLDLEEPKYSIEQIAAKTGKAPAYVAHA